MVLNGFPIGLVWSKKIISVGGRASADTNTNMNTSFKATFQAFIDLICAAGTGSVFKWEDGGAYTKAGPAVRFGFTGLLLNTIRHDLPEFILGPGIHENVKCCSTRSLRVQV